MFTLFVCVSFVLSELMQLCVEVIELFMKKLYAAATLDVAYYSTFNTDTNNRLALQDGVGNHRRQNYRITSLSLHLGLGLNRLNIYCLTTTIYS